MRIVQWFGVSESPVREDRALFFGRYFTAKQ